MTNAGYHQLTVGEELPPGSKPRLDDHAAAPATETFPPAPAPPITFKHSERVDLIFGALAAAQGKIENPVKTKKAVIKTEKGTYTYWYCDIADVLAATRKPFSENGISVSQYPTQEERTIKVGNQDKIFTKVTIETYLGHKSGQWMACSIWAMADGAGPQAVGSVSTYLRRYGLQLIAGIAADDDEDGQAGQGDQSGGADGNVRGGQERPTASGPRPTGTGPSTPENEVYFEVSPVGNVDTKPASGGRTQWLFYIPGQPKPASTVNKALAEKILRERDTGMPIRWHLKRVGSFLNLEDAEVLPPGSLS